MFSRFFLMVIGFLLVYSNLNAQEITILDGLTQHRIQGVKVESLSLEIQRLTNSKGRFQLEDFYSTDSLIISFPGFVSQRLKVENLKSIVTIELEDKPISIEETVVTANKWEQHNIEVPGKITKLNLKNIDILGPQTTADLLDNSGYVFIQKSQLAGGSPQLRGFGTNRVMIIVDGVRMNNAIFRSGNLQNVISLDANSLSGVEVLFGPGAVMYGSDAIGGVMHF